MAERLNAAVLKTVVPRGTVGSNPTSSASEITSVRRNTYAFFVSVAYALNIIRANEG